MDRLAKIYEQRNEPDGRVRVLRVPIFAEHVRERLVLDYETGKEVVEKIPFDREWLESACADARREQAKGHTPPLHLRHNSTGAATPTEPVGTYENLEVADVDLSAEGDEPDVKAVVFADLVYHDAEAFAQSKRYPHRSVEIYDYREPRINSLAHLGSEEPFFRFPNLRVRDERSSLALTYRRGPAYAVRWEDKPMPPKPETVQAVATPTAPVTAAAPKPEAPEAKPITATAPAPAPVASNAPPPSAAPAASAPAQPAQPQGDQTSAALQQIMAVLHEIKAAMGAGAQQPVAPQAPGAGTVAPVASAAPRPEATATGQGGNTGLPPGHVVTSAPCATTRERELETEKLVLAQRVQRFERREAARSAFEKLEQEGHLVGPELRAHFERIAEAGESLDSHLSLARMGAPKAPPRASDLSSALSAGEAATADAPEVIAAGAIGTPQRERARKLAAEYRHLAERGVVRCTLSRFLELEAKTDQANAKAKAGPARARRTSPNS